MNFVFEQFRPHSRLAPFIEVYWRLDCHGDSSLAPRVVPDGCVDLIINRGEDFEIDDGQHILKHGKMYLGGALTKHMDARFCSRMDAMFKKTIRQYRSRRLRLNLDIMTMPILLMK